LCGLPVEERHQAPDQVAVQRPSRSHRIGWKENPVKCRNGDLELYERRGACLREAGAPGLRITLHGAAGGTDVRALQEAGVLADLQAKQGVLGGIRNLANRTERAAIRDALAARATGATPTLAPEHQKTLDEWAGAKTISDDQLRTLAAARAETLKAALVQGRGIDAARITLGDPQVDRDRGMPAVMIALGG